MNKFLRIVIAFLVFIILVYLPVVPVSTAPVVLNSTYTVRLKSIYDILWFAYTGPDGISYQWIWSTYVVMFVLLAIGSLASVLMFKRSRGSPKN